MSYRPLLVSAALIPAAVVLAVLVAGLFGTFAWGEEAATPSATAVTPDYEYFKERVAPIIARTCANCHANPRKRLGRHFLRPLPGRKVREEDLKDNYETVLSLIVPGDPSKSLWLLKALTDSQGGVRHKGGVQFRIDGLEYATFVDFITGERLAKPSVTGTTPARIPEVGREALVLAAEDFERSGEARETEAEGAAGTVVSANAGTLRLTQRFRAASDAHYAITFRGLVSGASGAAGDVGGDPRPRFTFRVDDGPPVPVEAASQGFAWVGPAVACDGSEPLRSQRGEFRVSGNRLAMAGKTGAPAAWLSPAEVDHAGVEARFLLAPEDEGGDDALLLFDMKDAANGRYAGLVDGGRRFVIGLVEAGKLRALASVEAPPAPSEAGGVRTVRVSEDGSVLTARLDGKALHALETSKGEMPKRPARGSFGALSHGRVEVLALSAFAQYDVHHAAFAVRPLVRLRGGEHTLSIELAPEGPALDSVRIQVSAP